MKSSIRLILAFGLLTLVPWAHGADRNDFTRVRELHAGKELLDSLVINSMRLADEDDALKRAEYCTDLAESLAAEIKRCWENQHTRRGIELSRRQGELLRVGIAGNLVSARQAIPAGSAEEKTWNIVADRIRERVERISPVMKDQIDSTLAKQAEMVRAMSTVDGAIDEVYKAINAKPGK